MIKRKMEKLNLELPLLGFGCMRLPTLKNGDIDYKHGFKMVDYALEQGVNYFDTAYMYHDYKSEIFTGEALKRHPRNSFYLATKMPLVKCETKEDVKNIFDEQLKKCQVDYFDFYLIHAVDRTRTAKIDNLDVYNFLRKKQTEGKIKYLGFSFHDSPEVLQDVVDKYEWDFAQIQLNYLDWTVQDAEKSYKILKEKGIPCIVMEPVRGGFLANLPENTAKIFTDYRPDATIASWALRWVGSLPNVKVILSGMSDIDQVVDNIKTFSDFKPYTDEEYTVLGKVVTELKNDKAVPCTNCKYCIECPAGVKIPEIFELYNRHIIYKEMFRVKHNYSLLADGEKASACMGCNLCSTKCPQQIDIPDKLKVAEEAICQI